MSGIARSPSSLSRVAVAIASGLVVVATSPSVARAQPQPGRTISGTLIRIWADPAPGDPRPPTDTLHIVAPDGRSSVPVVVPDRLLDAQGGVDALLGHSVSVRVSDRAPLRLPGEPLPVPEAAALEVSPPTPAAAAAPLTPDGLAYRVRGEVVGWQQLPRPYATYLSDTNGDGQPDPNLSALQADCLDAADPVIDFSTVDGVVLVFNDALGCCAYGGASGVSKDGVVNRRIGVTWHPPGWATSPLVVVHEMGHTLGLGHMGDERDALSRIDPMIPVAMCTIATPIGCRAGHISTPHKDQLGYIPAARRFVLPAGLTETILLEAIALPPSTGAYLTAVIPIGGPSGSDRAIVVESRWRRGHDIVVSDDFVAIYRVDPDQFDRATVLASSRFDVTHEAVMWRVGEVFTDPESGVTVRVDAATASGHVVTLSRPAAVPVSNNSCVTAKDIDGDIFRDSVATETLVDAGDLPSAICGPVTARSVWYRFVPTRDGSLSVAATSSLGGATVSVWAGACGRLAITHADPCGVGGHANPSQIVDVRAGMPMYIAATVTSDLPARLTVTSTFTPSTSPPSCVTAVSPAIVTVPAAGGDVTLTASTSGAACTFFVSTGQTWATGLPRSLSDPTAVLRVAANTGATRSQRVRISDQFVLLTQQGCPVDDDDCDGLPTSWERRFGLDPTDDTGVDGGAADPDGDGLTNQQEYANRSHPRGTSTRFFAEGATGTFFNARLALANPSTQPITALLRFLTTAGRVVTLPVSLAPQQRQTINPETVPMLASAEFSTVVEADGPIVADRLMQWGSVGYGSHAETAIVAPSRSWYLAEGSTAGNFSLFYLLQNPSTTERATVRVRYLLPPPAVPLEKTYTLDPSSRFNIWVNEEVFDGLGKALAATDVSAAIDVTSGAPIVVERAMYLSRPGEYFSAGHESAGVTAPATTWMLAEGATGPYFDEFVLIANPNSVAAQVEARYLLPNGATYTKTHVVPAASRYNIWVDMEDIPGAGAVLANTAVSVTLSSINDVPVVVERAMWWPGSPAEWMEAHNSPGATAAGTRWAMAEGEIGGPGETETYILVANVSPTMATIRVTLLFEDGTTQARDFAVGPQSRFNVSVRDEFPAASGKRFGATVESLGTTPADLVVERAMYSNALGVTWAAGTNALATRW